MWVLFQQVARYSFFIYWLIEISMLIFNLIISEIIDSIQEIQLIILQTFVPGLRVGWDNPIPSVPWDGTKIFQKVAPSHGILQKSLSHGTNFFFPSHPTRSPGFFTFLVCRENVIFIFWNRSKQLIMVRISFCVKYSSSRMI